MMRIPVSLNEPPYLIRVFFFTSPAYNYPRGPRSFYHVNARNSGRAGGERVRIFRRNFENALCAMILATIVNADATFHIFTPDVSRRRKMHRRTPAPRNSAGSRVELYAFRSLQFIRSLFTILTFFFILDLLKIL